MHDSSESITNYEVQIFLYPVIALRNVLRASEGTKEKEKVTNAELN